MEASGGQIKTGVYHSEIGDGEKERLHLRWRRGEVQVVCATIAFGLGIDKGDVRFVLHHSVSSVLIALLYAKPNAMESSDVCAYAGIFGLPNSINGLLLNNI